MSGALKNVLKLPHGFLAAAGTAGIKASSKPDCALIVSSAPLRWALTATTNTLKAACVTRNRDLYGKDRPVRAVVINSGNANCANGVGGERLNERFAAAAAAALELSAHEVLTASTGVIGEPLPVEKLEAALPALSSKLTDGVEPLAQAILTTDLVQKTAEVTLSGGARIVGIAKGSGMIHPNMATMFGFILTDADMPQGTLRTLWPEVVAKSFNQVTVDGDTSPNDMAFLLANSQVKVDEAEFTAGLLEVTQNLAKQIARDGEGATKLLAVEVTGAVGDTEARRAAQAVVLSPLVKSAAHGNDPNWGRILSSVGAAGVRLELAKLSIRVQDTLVYEGSPQTFEAGEVSRAMDAPELLIQIDLGVGAGSGAAWGCDLTADYVRINADYHT